MPTDHVAGPIGPVRRGLQGCAGLLGLVLVFETLRATDVLPTSAVPGVGTILAALAESFGSGAMTSALASTVQAWLAGLAVAAVIAIPLGVAVGLSSWADSTTKRAVEFLRPVPVVALVPMAVVIFGIELGMQVFLVALACTWPILLGTRAGVRAVDPLQLDTARTFGLGPVSVVRRVVVPAIIPAIATSLRVAASLGVVVAIAAQLVSGSPGLGQLLIASQRAGNNDVVWACLLVAGMFGVVVNVSLAALERRVASWQELSTEARR